MTPRPDPRLVQLAELAAMIRDLQILRFGQAARACSDTRARLVDLDSSARAPTAEDPMLAQAALRHERWADRRRVALNSVLATRTALLLVEQEAARKTFGRANVLARLADPARD